MQIKIYLPTDKEQYINYIAKWITELFNGCTIYRNCLGFWKNPQNQVEKDKITVIEVFTEEIEENCVPNWKQLILVLSRIKCDLKQSCVAYTIDNSMYFYE